MRCGRGFGRAYHRDMEGAEDQRVPMISARCRSCGQVWVATLKSIARWPDCPFCGSDRVRRTAIPTQAIIVFRPENGEG